MGCDIHLFAEKRNEDGTWTAIKGVSEPDLKEYESLIENSNQRGDNPSSTYWMKRVEEVKQGTFDFIWSNRNYVLFSILADVRNSHNITPIAHPKGLPDDISEAAKESANYWDGDGHSQSYLTVSELLGFDWEQGFQQEGWVNSNGYKLWKEKGSPDSWSRSVGGGGVDHVTHYDMENFLQDNGEYFGSKIGKSPYTLVQWKDTYKDYAGSFYTWSLPKLKELAGEDTESVRIVFWFDN